MTTRGRAFSPILFATVFCAGLPALNHAAAAAPAGSNTVDLVLTEGTNMSIAASPDGSRIVAAIQGTLWSIPASGGAAKKLTAPEMDAQEPAWSPDGKMVAFYAYTSSNFHIWVMNPDGSGLRRITDSRIADSRYPSFTADSQQVLYSSDEEGGYSIWSQDLATGARRKLTTPAEQGYVPDPRPRPRKAGNAVYPAMSPDGRTLAFVLDGASDRLVIREIAGGPIRTLYTGKVLGAPAWSRSGDALYVVDVDGKKAALTRVPLVGAPNTINDSADIFPFRPIPVARGILAAADGKLKTFPLDGTSPTVTPFEARIRFTRPTYRRKAYDLTDGSARKAVGLVNPVLSKDGSRAVYAALGDLWLADLNNGSLSKLTDDDAFEAMPSWSPDDAQIAFVSNRGGKSDIWTVSLADRTFKRLTDMTSIPDAPVWSPNGGSIAYEVGDIASETGTRIDVLDLKDGSSRTIASNLNEPSNPIWSPSGKMIAVVDHWRPSSRFREGLSAIHLFPASGTGEAKWVFPVKDRTLGHRQGNRLAWSKAGQMIYRIDGELWSANLDDQGNLGASRQRIADNGEDPAFSSDGTKLIYHAGAAMMLYDTARNRASKLDIAPRLKRKFPAESYTIRTNRLFDGTSDGYRRADVVVEKGIITAVRNPGGPSVIGELIDVGDRVVMPGLIESHAHSATTVKLIDEWLKRGVTTIRETGAEAYDSAQRREVEWIDRRPSPRLFGAGPTGDGSRVFYGAAEPMLTGRDAERMVANGSALGQDLMKHYVRNDYALQKIYIAAAHKAGLPVTGHDLYPSVANGADGVEHTVGTSRRGYSMKASALGYTYQDVIDIIAKSRVFYTPTLVLRTDFGARENPQALAAVGEIYRKGGLISAGTDTPLATAGLSLHAEIRLLSEAGLGPAAALRAASAMAAKNLNVSQIGTVQSGKMADIIVIDGDPLANIGDTLKVVLTMKNGEIVFRK